MQPQRGEKVKSAEINAIHVHGAKNPARPEQEILLEIFQLPLTKIDVEILYILNMNEKFEKHTLQK